MAKDNRKLVEVMPWSAHHTASPGRALPATGQAGIPLTPALDVGTRAGYGNRSFSIASNNLRRITPDQEQRERKSMTPAKLRVYFHRIGLISNRALPFHPARRSAASTRSRVRRSKGRAACFLLPGHSGAQRSPRPVNSVEH